MHTDEHGFGESKIEGFNTENTEVTEGHRENLNFGRIVVLGQSSRNQFDSDRNRCLFKDILLQVFPYPC